MKSEMLGMIDEQYKSSFVKQLEEEIKRLQEDLSLYKKVNLDLRKEITMLEKLIELNMKDLHNIADQRDWYYEEYQKLKTKDCTE
jgi:translation initiation factor 2B subunit (eIF-2B alpha/beta/delta family)